MKQCTGGQDNRRSSSLAPSSPQPELPLLRLGATSHSPQLTLLPSGDQVSTTGKPPFSSDQGSQAVCLIGQNDQYSVTVDDDLLVHEKQTTLKTFNLDQYLQGDIDLDSLLDFDG